MLYPSPYPLPLPSQSTPHLHPSKQKGLSSPILRDFEKKTHNKVTCEDVSNCADSQADLSLYCAFMQACKKIL